MDTRSIKRNYQLQQWRKIIQEQTTSGLTIDEFCKQNGLSRVCTPFPLSTSSIQSIRFTTSIGYIEFSITSIQSTHSKCSIRMVIFW